MTGPAPGHALRMIASTPSTLRTAEVDATTKLRKLDDPWPTSNQPLANKNEPFAPTDRDNLGRFLTGNGGGGRPKGAKNKLTENVLNTLAGDFAVHGAQAVKLLRESDPATYLKLIAWILPRDLILKREQEPEIDLAELTGEEAAALVDAEDRRKVIRRALGRSP